MVFSYHSVLGFRAKGDILNFIDIILYPAKICTIFNITWWVISTKL